VSTLNIKIKDTPHLAEVPGVERGNKKNRILYVIAGQRTGPNGLKFDACLLKLFAL